MKVPLLLWFRIGSAITPDGKTNSHPLLRREHDDVIEARSSHVAMTRDNDDFNFCSAQFFDRSTCPPRGNLVEVSPNATDVDPHRPELQELIPDDDRPILTVDLMGGLGNQLFMISTLLAVARSSSKELTVGIRNVQSVCCERQTYFDSMFKHLKAFLSSPSSSLGKRMERNSVASECKFEEQNNWRGVGGISDDYAVKLVGSLQDIREKRKCSVIMLSGYFQDVRYFAAHLPWLKELFWDSTAVGRAEQALTDLVHGKSRSSVVSIHYRMGDIANTKTGEIREQASNDNYHLRALSEVKRRVKHPLICMIFSDSPGPAAKRSEILSDCAERVAVPASLDDLAQFYMMSMVPSSIIENSTYSYWAAMLAREEKLMIYPANIPFDSKMYSEVIWHHEQLPQQHVWVPV